MTGADLIIKKLIERGVDTVFGYPGGAAMPLYDSLYKNRREIKHIRGAHEQGAAHAADGYARATGRVGVCFATSGPGATNLVTGIATAFADSVPMVFITANVASFEMGTDSFQEADITGITLPICKYNWIVKDFESLGTIIEKAFSVAKSGRPGPVLVDIPSDFLIRKIEKKSINDNSAVLNDTECRIPEIEFPQNKDFEKIAEMINKAERPFVICGGGVRISGASEEYKTFVEKINAPSGYTLMAADILPKNHYLNVGMLGKYGISSANDALGKADLVIAVGMRFSNRTHAAISNDKKIVHIDADKAEINKVINVDGFLVGDAGRILGELTEFIIPKNNCWLDSSAGKNALPEDEKISAEIFQKVGKTFPEDTFIVTDVGLHQMWVARNYPFQGKGKFITSGGFGTMGYGIGAAVGAAVGNPEAGVVLFTGDGSFKMGLCELLMIKETKAKLLIIVMNNGSLGMVRRMQKLQYGRHYIATEGKYNVPNISKIAKAYGLLGKTVKNRQAFDKALDEFLQKNKSMVIDVRI